MDINKIIYIFRAIRLSGIARTILYGLARDRIEEQFPGQMQTTRNISPGRLISSQPIPRGVQLEFENAHVELIFLTHSLVRISWEPGKPPVSYTLAKNEWPAVQPVINLDTGEITLTSEELAVTIDNTGGISFHDYEGAVFKRDNPPLLAGEGWSISTNLSPEEHIYGLGERAGGLNLRPGKYITWNSDIGGSYSRGKDPLYIGIPLYLSLSDVGSYLVYFENSYRSTFQVAQNLEALFSGGMLRYYVIFGSLAHIFKQLADLIGYPCMPPQWALGYHQSRWGYRSEAEIRSVIDGFNRYELPISAIHLDIDYMDGFRLFTTNSRRFPNIKQLTNELDEKGVKVVATINPAVKRDQGYKVYTEGISRDVFCKLPDGEVLNGVSWPGWCVFPDFTNIAARSWWQEQYKSLLDKGISGIWHDMNEPASFAAWGDKSFPISTVHSLEGQSGDHHEAHNLYGLLMNQAGYEALLRYTANKRPWILSRSGWAGMQRYAWNWTGDIESSWEALQQTIPTILGLALSGQGFTGVDIGGFSGSPSAELYLRWFQMATFLPFFRTHSAVGTHKREPWVYGEPTTSIIRNFLHLRYQLIPYFYTLAWDSTQTGIPPIRPIFWASPKDKTLWEVEDEFLFGDALLVAPIIQKKVLHRQVVLPPGQWFSYWDNQLYLGPTKFELPVSIETIPIFVKAGTLLPLKEDGQITFHLYPDMANKSSCHLYLDRGDGFDTWRVDAFELTPAPNTLSISWGKMGKYPFPQPGIIIKVHDVKITKAVADGTQYPHQNNRVLLPIFQSLKLEFE